MVEISALKDSRQRVVGTRETLKRVVRRTAVCVYVARDADPKLIDDVVRQCEAYHVPVQYVDTMVDLGRSCGIEVKAACAAVVASRL